MQLIKILKQEFSTQSRKSSLGFSSKKWYLKCVTVVLNGLITMPVCVCFWASTWLIQSTFIFPDKETISLVISWLIGNTILFIAYIFQDILQELHNKLAKKCQLKICHFDLAFLLRCNSQF